MKYLLTLLVLVASNLSAQKATKHTQLDEILNSLISDQEIPGISVAVSKNGEMIYKGSFGYRDIKNEKPVDENTLFRTASTCKLFASSAIALLIERGQIDIDDPVEKYIEDYPHEGKGVTIRRILNHTSGIRHYGAGDALINIRNYESTEAALKIFIKDDLDHEPGSEYSYSTHAFTLLAAIVEKVSGQSYTHFLDQEIFTPLGMERTQPDIKGSTDDNTSKLYKKVKETKFDNPSYKRAGGGMLSTASDLVKFGNAHLQAGFFKPATLALIMEPSIELPGSIEPTRIGMAWRISKDVNGNKIYHHAGRMNGARSFLMVSPSDSTVVAIMTNNGQLSFIETFACSIRDILVKEQNKIQKSWNYQGATLTLKEEKLYTEANVSIEDMPSINTTLVYNYSDDGNIFRNTRPQKDLLYLVADQNKLRIYLKNEDDSWEEHIYEK